MAINYEHQEAASPYRSSGPVFIRESAQQATLAKNTIPTLLLHRQISVRGYNTDGMMIHADITSGSELDERIRTAFENPDLCVIHLHYAIPGCFACAIHPC